ncbi:hypothetical protein Tco_1092995 [Tanacetum coccineum]|uniref:Uncharacterized protein n=1 Tax=Tanacetum coccineum TaxID=301880 RepID=A0ABQ5IDV3_9ASTR
MTNRKMQNSTAYKTYLAIATGAATPKKARKFKKHASPSKKKVLVVVEEPAEKPIKKPSPKRYSVENDIKQSKRETTIHQVSGLSKGADLEPEVPDEQKGKSINTSEGTSSKQRLLDVSKADSSESEYKSYGDSDNDNDQQSDDERTESSDDKSALLRILPNILLLLYL